MLLCITIYDLHEELFSLVLHGDHIYLTKQHECGWELGGGENDALYELACMLFRFSSCSFLNSLSLHVCTCDISQISEGEIFT
jgi:hypothetical protein